MGRDRHQEVFNVTLPPPDTGLGAWQLEAAVTSLGLLRKLEKRKEEEQYVFDSVLSVGTCLHV